jgi:hypothetical protein
MGIAPYSKVTKSAGVALKYRFRKVVLQPPPLWPERRVLLMGSARKVVSSCEIFCFGSSGLMEVRID